MTAPEQLPGAPMLLDLLLAPAWVVGAPPGLSATMAIAVLVPASFAMPPASALLMPGAICTGAVLVVTPRMPSAIAATRDGQPFARRGKGQSTARRGALAALMFTRGRGPAVARFSAPRSWRFPAARRGKRARLLVCPLIGVAVVAGFHAPPVRALEVSRPEGTPCRAGA